MENREGTREQDELNVVRVKAVWDKVTCRDIFKLPFMVHRNINLMSP